MSMRRNAPAETPETVEASGTVGRVSITVIVDDRAGEGLETEHGFSLWVECDDLRVLFDAGEGGAFRPNVARLGIPIETADAIVLSHGHHDHGGGLLAALEMAPRARLLVARGALTRRYALERGPEAQAVGRIPGESRELGIPAESREVGISAKSREVGIPAVVREALEGELAARIEWVDAPLPLAPGVGLTGAVPRETAYEDVGGPFFLDPDGATPDGLPDDQALWIRTAAGLVVCVGCSHAGVVNTLERARAISGTSHIRAVVGGFHLLQAGAERLDQTLQAFTDLALESVVPCHCTGTRAVRRLEQHLGPAIVRPGHSGMRLEF